MYNKTMVRGQANDGGRVIVGDEETEIPTLSLESRHFAAYALHSSDKNIHALNQTCGAHYNTWILKIATSQYPFYHTSLCGYGLTVPHVLHTQYAIRIAIQCKCALGQNRTSH